jgi:hypothetical protein
MGGNVARVAAALGKPLMPWQRYVADVAGEIDERGHYAWPLLIVSIQRQTGKTTLDLAQSTQRALQAPHRKVWHTAQTGQDARKKWREFVEELMTSQLRKTVGELRKGNGDESLTFLNGSKFRPHKPAFDALHGEQSDTNNIDEGWVFSEVEGAALMQAITPTQLTRPGAQTFIWSTRGDTSSTWFHNLIEQGYAGVPGIALFDFGIPFDSDPLDLDNLVAHHPAVGYTQTRESIAAAMASIGHDKPGEIARALGNVPTGAGERVIPREAWDATRTTDPLPLGRPAYGIGVSADGTWGSLWAAVVGPDGTPWAEQVARRPGRAWLVDRVLALRDAGQGVAVDRRGPAGPVADALELAGVELLTPGADYPAACQDFFDRITDPAGPRVRLRDPVGGADEAADVAGRRMVSDGSWVWSRTRSTGHIDALEGANMAVWAVARAPVPVTIGRVHFA